MSSPRGREILNYLRDQRDEMIEFLRALVTSESPSVVPGAQREVRQILTDALHSVGFKTLHIAGRESGGQLFARPAKRIRHKPCQLLLGHYDTVWPLGTLTDMPFQVDGSSIKGPGVFDMKGGLTQIIFALKCMREMKLEPEVTPVVYVNSDEEIGSRDSTRHIKSLARFVNRALVLEPSLGPSGKIKTARKGVGRFIVKVKGKAAHAGLDPEGGASAILELSHVIQALFALNDAEKGITVNVGTIDGGLRPNVIAPTSRAIVDVRVRTQEDAEHIRKKISGLKSVTPGVTLDIEGRIGRPALEPTPRNQSLWRLAHELGEEIGLQLEQGLAGGGSDGNTTSQYTATLDGLGPVGDGAHAPHEFLDLDQTTERAALLTLLLLAPALAAESKH